VPLLLLQAGLQHARARVEKILAGKVFHDLSRKQLLMLKTEEGRTERSKVSTAMFVLLCYPESQFLNRLGPYTMCHIVSILDAMPAASCWCCWCACKHPASQQYAGH
jgi:hypothetical protein